MIAFNLVYIWRIRNSETRHVVYMETKTSLIQQSTRRHLLKCIYARFLGINASEWRLRNAYAFRRVYHAYCLGCV